jgi:hypothetical protein
MTLRAIERWIHLGVLLPVVAIILGVIFGPISPHGDGFGLVAVCLGAMSISGLVALVNAIRLFPHTRGTERQRVDQAILVGALFGVGPIILVIAVLMKI